MNMLYFLSMNKNIQDKLREEIVNVVGKDLSQFNGNHLKNLKYLSCVIWETLRLRCNTIKFIFYLIYKYIYIF